MASRLDPINTYEVLACAAGRLQAATTADVFMDSGVENINGTVDKLFDSTALRRVIAQVEVSFSNSLIEAWWLSLKHQWLFLHPLDNLATVRQLVALYITEHSQTIPHSAFPPRELGQHGGVGQVGRRPAVSDMGCYGDSEYKFGG